MGKKQRRGPWQRMDLSRLHEVVAGAVAPGSKTADRPKGFAEAKAGGPATMLRYLQRKASQGKYASRQVMAAHRASFNRKDTASQGELCIVCQRVASHRHHIRPLYRRGDNAKSNIVHLCRSCHAEIHPWLDPSAFRFDDQCAAHLSECAIVET